MSLTNPTAVVTEERLNEYHQTILPYLGGMPDILANKFNKSDLYSTDEKIIGRWTDGKPLYQKTFIYNKSDFASGENKLNHNVADVDYVWLDFSNSFVVDFFQNKKQQRFFISVSMAGDYSCYLDLITTTQINFYIGSAIYNRMVSTNSVVITIRYTKTTDSTVEIGLDTDYSTTEKIVGTWIDGKPIYQKVLETTMPTVVTEGTEVAKEISVGASVAKFIDIKLIASANGYDLMVNNYYNAKTTIIDVSGGTKNGGVRAIGRNNFSSSTTKNLIVLTSGAINANGATAYIIVQYTKTTD